METSGHLSLAFATTEGARVLAALGKAGAFLERFAADLNALRRGDSVRCPLFPKGEMIRLRESANVVDSIPILTDASHPLRKLLAESVEFWNNFGLRQASSFRRGHTCQFPQHLVNHDSGRSGGRGAMR